jgi:predicted ABC-type transport system involved in lysophospholipase L1 biosynthesis ATPase subunit
MGTSGSGKSTLLSLVVGLLRPVSGSVQVLDADLAGLRASRLARFRRRHLGVVFQSGELLPALTAVENTAMPLLLDGASWPVASRTATELLDELGIAQDSQSIPAADLSGGERQRTALARAIVTGAELILADEPTGALDGAARDNVADLLFGLPLDRGCALLVVTHDPAIAARAGRVLALAGGALRPVALAQ